MIIRREGERGGEKVSKRMVNRRESEGEFIRCNQGQGSVKITMRGRIRFENSSKDFILFSRLSNGLSFYVSHHDTFQ